MRLRQRSYQWQEEVALQKSVTDEADNGRRESGGWVSSGSPGLREAAANSWGLYVPRGSTLPEMNTEQIYAVGSQAGEAGSTDGDMVGYIGNE